MSKVFRCEACGEVFERVADAGRFGVMIRGEVLAFLKGETGTSPFKIDVCPGCSKELGSYLEKWWTEVKK